LAYDLIGDIHGHADKLTALLGKLGYESRAGTWRHPDRTAIFVGDFIDRGVQQLETLEIVRAMIDGGHARAVMGNHEFNAIAWSQIDPANPGQHLRRRNDKNRRQHAAFLAAVGEDSELHTEWTEWFLTLPLWLDLGGLRVVHACWDSAAVATVRNILGGALLNRDVMPDACRIGAAGTSSFAPDGTRSEAGSDLFLGIETLLKGIEVDLPHGRSFFDKDGHERSSVRTCWWQQSPVSYRDGAMLPASDRHILPDVPMPDQAVPGHDGGSPVFVGHYWMTGLQTPIEPRVACVDYSAGRGGPLVAYRWTGEAELAAGNFVASH
jgi:hypothetical protein